MIDKRELRIGNYVLNHNVVDEIQSVHTACHTLHSLEEQLTEFFEPIVLSDQWLKDFYFKEKEKDLWVHQWNGFIFRIQKVGSAFFVKSLSGTIESGPIRYVHQMQNTYFGLSGYKDLTLKK